MSGALATDGSIYCIPAGANQVLAIDPWGEFRETTKANMEAHPDKFGFLFQKIAKVGEGSTLNKSKTNFDHAIVKFGQKQVYEVHPQRTVLNATWESRLTPHITH